MKIYVFWFQLHWVLFPRDWLAIGQRWLKMVWHQSATGTEIVITKIQYYGIYILMEQVSTLLFVSFVYIQLVWISYVSGVTRKHDSEKKSPKSGSSLFQSSFWLFYGEVSVVSVDFSKCKKFEQFTESKLFSLFQVCNFGNHYFQYHDIYLITQSCFVFKS